MMSPDTVAEELSIFLNNYGGVMNVGILGVFYSTYTSAGRMSEVKHIIRAAGTHEFILSYPRLFVLQKTINGWEIIDRVSSPPPPPPRRRPLTNHPLIHAPPPLINHPLIRLLANPPPKHAPTPTPAPLVTTPNTPPVTSPAAPLVIPPTSSIQKHLSVSQRERQLLRAGLQDLPPPPLTNPPPEHAPTPLVTLPLVATPNAPHAPFATLVLADEVATPNTPHGPFAALVPTDEERELIVVQAVKQAALKIAAAKRFSKLLIELDSRREGIKLGQLSILTKMFLYHPNPFPGKTGGPHLSPLAIIKEIPDLVVKRVNSKNLIFSRNAYSALGDNEDENEDSNSYPPPSIVAPKPNPFLETKVKTLLIFVDTDAKFDYYRPFSFDVLHSYQTRSFFVDCIFMPSDDESTNNLDLSLILVSLNQNTVYVFDCVSLGSSTVARYLYEMLTSSAYIKVFHDVHRDALALSQLGIELAGVLDIQLAIELQCEDISMSFEAMLSLLQIEGKPKSAKGISKANNSIYATRPLPQGALTFAWEKIALLRSAAIKLLPLMDPDKIDIVKAASDERVRLSAKNNGLHQITFDVTNDYALASSELLSVQQESKAIKTEPLVVSDDSAVVIDLLPKDFAQSLEHKTAFLSDINLDLGREPHAWVGGERIFLAHPERIVDSSDISNIVQNLGGAFGSDNRAGLPRQLHRISAIRNRNNDVIGLTMRIGRHVSGNATIVSDLLFRDPSKSILFLGEPGSGKTTLIRDVTRLLAERGNVCIVDTSNEIAGDGDVPHSCVGYARRLMVESIDRQADVMIECVQNHTPETMVIDEIGRPNEVEAARTCKQRGVRLMASAHGDLRKLCKNPKLKGLIGGIEQATLGDAAAAKNFGGSKLVSERAGAPVFDVIVELKRGVLHEFMVISDVGEAVDAILLGKQFKCQRRTRNPSTGEMLLVNETS